MAPLGSFAYPLTLAGFICHSLRGECVTARDRERLCPPFIHVVLIALHHHKLRHISVISEECSLATAQYFRDRVVLFQPSSVSFVNDEQTKLPDRE